MASNKRNLLVAASLAALAGWVSPALAVDDLSLNVAPGSETAAPGETVTVTLDVANLSASINGVQVRLQYNTSLLTLIDVVPAAGPGWTEVNQTAVAGALDWAAVINAGSTSANGLVATITFTAIAEGTTSVTFRADAPPFETKLTRASDNGTILPNKTNSGTITLTCDDGLFCNGAETFSGGSCQPGSDPCVDAVACTVNACDEGTDSCSFTPNNAACDDGLFCNGAETCHQTLGCQAGTNPCNDGVACTVDTCDEGLDTCSNTPNNGACDDGQHCNGAETCHATLGCQAGTAPNCDDSVACTVDSCNETTDSCDNIANNAACDDTLHCNGVETCSVTLGCQAGTPPNCDDSIACTVDTCNETTDSCDHTANNAACDDTLHCNGVETCSVTLGCQAGTAPNCNDSVGCTVDSCNETTDSCDNVANNAACDDTLHCNGVETCHVTLDCQPGTPPNCDDSIACTIDSCNETTDSCDHIANHAVCDDTLHCNGVETCSVTLGCQAGTAPNCDDGINCTDDSCDEVNDICVNAVNNANCDDGLYCNGSETCSATLDCVAGTFPCGDGVDCTDDSCVEATDTCVNTPNHANCDDGLFCTGVETCDAVLDCVAGSDPCLPTEFCNEVTNACDACVTPADCDDDNVCTSDACNAGACVYTDLFNVATECCNPVNGAIQIIDDGDPCTTDVCNSGTGAVAHNNAGEIDVFVKIQALNRAVTRDVTFVITDCGGLVETRTVPVLFNTVGNGSATLTGVDADSDWLAIREGHTLRRREALSFTTCQATVDLSGANLLQAGDLNVAGVPQDNLVDIVDFSILASRWNTPISANSGSGADISGDGLQGTADFNAIQANYFDVGDPVDGCPALSHGEGLENEGPVELLPVAVQDRSSALMRVAVDRLEIPDAERADVNRDGMVDAHDVRAFARRHGLKILPDFERKLRVPPSEMRDRDGARR